MKFNRVGFLDGHRGASLIAKKEYPYCFAYPFPSIFIERKVYETSAFQIAYNTRGIFGGVRMI